jgi:hypothetical protein
MGTVHNKNFPIFFGVSTPRGLARWHQRYGVTCCVRGVSKMFGEWYQKKNKTEDTNKLTLLAFKIIAILHNTLLETS